MTRHVSNPTAKVFGGPVDGSDLPPPTYVYSQGHAYMLMTEVGAMIERFARLPPVIVVDGAPDLSYTEP